jgi:hypothetical protein
MGGAPNWVSIFTERPDLDPPGYNEAFLAMIDKKLLKEQQAREQEVEKKSKKKKLGRGEKR